jgi:hypothetical protein
MMSSILTPMLVLVSWSLFMWMWMYATRIPAMKAADIDPQAAVMPGSLDVLPQKVRQVANNYNHLHEQPTVFYALLVYCHLAGTADMLMIQLAWAYVVIRVLHSLTQATFNKVMVRFLLFVLSNLTLIWMAVRNLMSLS